MHLIGDEPESRIKHIKLDATCPQDFEPKAYAIVMMDEKNQLYLNTPMQHPALLLELGKALICHACDTAMPHLMPRRVLPAHGTLPPFNGNPRSN